MVTDRTAQDHDLLARLRFAPMSTPDKALLMVLLAEQIIHRGKPPDLSESRLSSYTDIPEADIRPGVSRLKAGRYLRGRWLHVDGKLRLRYEIGVPDGDA